MRLLIGGKIDWMRMLMWLIEERRERKSKVVKLNTCIDKVYLLNSVYTTNIQALGFINKLNFTKIIKENKDMHADTYLMFPF